MNSKTTRRRGKRTLPRIVRHRVAVAVAFPVLWILDVLILAAGVSGMTWRDIRAESIDGWKRVWNNRPNAPHEQPGAKNQDV